MAERASSSSLINYIDFDKICRTCLKESDNLKSLFLNYGANDGCNYGVMVAECTKLQFAQNDGLPETICRVCIKDVKSAFAFKQKVEKSELALRTFYEQVKGKHAFEPSIKEEVGDDVNIKDEINVNDVKVDGQNDDDAFNNDDLHFNDNDDFSEDDVKPLNDYNNSLKKHVPQQEERSTETCATVSVSINQRDLLCASSSSIQKIPALSANLEIVSTKDRQLAEHAVSLLENACSDTIMFPRIENIYSLANDSSHPDRQQNVVAEILQTTPIGKALMQNYGKSGILDQAGRKRLCHLLVDFELKDDHDKILSPDRLTTLSQDITGIFKNEHSVTYYVPYISVGPGLKRLAKGKLLDCLNNRRKTLRAAGLIPSRKRPSGGASGSSSQELKMAREDDTDGAITWLRNRTDPWRFVEYYWNRTVKIRSRELLETKLTIAQYLELYPALKKPDGYLLLQHDFAAVYPAAVNKLYETFPIYKKKIYSLARMKLRQIIEVGVEKQRLTDILACEEESGDINDLGCFLSLPYLVGVTTLRRKKGSYRPSRKDMRDSFITLVAAENLIPETVTRRRNKLQDLGHTLQPFIIAVGPSLKQLKTYYVAADDTLYQRHSCLDAVDCCFKIIMQLTTDYPNESSMIWSFIQQGFYGFSPTLDKMYPSVVTLLCDVGVPIKLDK